MDIIKESMKTNRWLLTFPPELGFGRSWVTRVDTPKLVISKNHKIKCKKMKIILYDSIHPYKPRNILDWILLNDGIKETTTDIKLQLLDPTGVVVVKWDLLDCKLKSVDFGSFNIGDNSPVEISLTIKPKEIKINKIQL
jgi:hypothetical protein